ncbi:hypothetical protein LTR37_004567 [Vermiconidia calcicola]|uniref:Uncharacterized protein n=1 Tax=Vermiconidia calcicola TaxID=1690605 RepID=A0ACC3NL66_9PEZI|nr:hypothetical protein LTR37_004567 [Vermiconidia calcicola]
MEPYVREEPSKLWSGLQKCKSLAKVIKSRRAPPWPSTQSTALPPRHVCDQLVGNYLRTSETVYRVLHVPTFNRDYEAMWASNSDPDHVWLLQLKLVLAIGAATHDEQFSMRTEATHWVYEAHTWLSAPGFKSRLNIQPLQVSLLTLLAREATGVGEELNGISAGTVLRTAICMGLHRDPTRLPKMAFFAAEMRRRLWNTILELNLQSSITSGESPLFSLNDFDTDPPGNYEDEQVATTDPVPNSEDDLTTMSVAIALRKTFPLRLAITKFLNDLGSHGTYEKTLHLDAELRAAYKAMRRVTSRAKPQLQELSRFGAQVMDLIVHRYLLALHLPFFGLALREAAYAFTRQVLVDTAHNIWRAVYPSDSVIGSLRGERFRPDESELARLTRNGSGFFRIAATQACLVIALELRSQLQQGESLGPGPLRPDLLSIMEETKSWALECVEAGETNVKGCLLISGVSAHVDGLRRGLGQEDLAQLLMKEAEEGIEKCLAILEVSVTDGSATGDRNEVDKVTLDMQPGRVEDWEFVASDSLFDFGNLDSMNWIFDDTMGREFALL